MSSPYLLYYRISITSLLLTLLSPIPPARPLIGTYEDIRATKVIIGGVIISLFILYTTLLIFRLDLSKIRPHSSVLPITVTMEM